MDKPHEATLVFIREKETKNTVRYAEQPIKDAAPVVGTLYVAKWFAKDVNEFHVRIYDRSQKGVTLT